jgi:uncharacterized protein
VPNPVVHFEIVGPDAEKLLRFYSDVFGWSIDSSNPMNYGVVDNGGEGINGGISAGQGDSSYVTFYIEVDDPDAFLRKIEEAGGETVMETTEIPGMVTFAQFRDPGGHMVGLVKAQ